MEATLYCPHCGKRQIVITEDEGKKNPFEILQVSEEAEDEVIEASYKSLAKKYHPDIAHADESDAKIQDINWAYSILSDKKKRAEWQRKSGQPKDATSKPNESATTSKRAEKKNKKEQASKGQAKQEQAKKEQAKKEQAKKEQAKKEQAASKEKPEEKPTLSSWKSAYSSEQLESKTYPRPRKSKPNSSKQGTWTVILVLAVVVVAIFFSIRSNANSKLAASQPEATSRPPTPRPTREPTPTRILSYQSTQTAVAEAFGNFYQTCTRWDRLNRQRDVNNETCVYGKIVKIVSSGNTTFYFQDPQTLDVDPDFRIFAPNAFFSGNITEGVCVYAEGKLIENGPTSYLYINPDVVTVFDDNSICNR